MCRSMRVIDGDGATATTRAPAGRTPARVPWAKVTPWPRSDLWKTWAAYSGGFEDACGSPNRNRSSFTRSAEMGGQSCQ